MNSTYRALTEAVIAGEAPEAEALTREALARRRAPEEILDEGLISAMDEVGRRFSTGEIYVPEMLIAARAMKKCLLILQPLLAQGEHESSGTVVIGTVRGDVHDIGKNLVSVMLEGAGFEVFDLGVDVPPEGFVRAIEERRPDILGMSALLTTTMPAMSDVLDALETAGVRERVKVMVGGAPVTNEFAASIGADGYAPNAAAATEAARLLVTLGGRTDP